MSLWQIIQRLLPFVRPYRRLVIATLLLTLAAQVNPFVLRYTVDTVQGMLDKGQGWSNPASSSCLLHKPLRSHRHTPPARRTTLRQAN